MREETGIDVIVRDVGGSTRADEPLQDVHVQHLDDLSKTMPASRSAAA